MACHAQCETTILYKHLHKVVLLVLLLQVAQLFLCDYRCQCLLVPALVADICSSATARPASYSNSNQFFYFLISACNCNECSSLQ